MSKTGSPNQWSVVTANPDLHIQPSSLLVPFTRGHTGEIFTYWFTDRHHPPVVSRPSLWMAGCVPQMPTVWTIYWSFPAMLCHLVIEPWKMPVPQKEDDKSSGCWNIFALREWEFWKSMVQRVSLPLLLGMKGRGSSCQILGADGGPGTLRLAAGRFPPLPSRGASWLTGTGLVS